MMRRSSRETGLGVELRRQVSEHVQTVGVAIANATYAAARRIARFAALLARNAFPTYRPS
jgi:hypothetical protein